MTFSIIARCAETGMMGIAISSSSPAVAARCAHARAGVGVVATQNITDPALGPRGLDLMRDGLTASEALGRMMKTNANAPWRQVMLLDSSGLTAQHSGEHTLGINNLAHGKDCAAGGNLLANPDVPARMVAAFEASAGHLGDRLLAVMRAALAAGGEAGPVHSAGMLVVREVSWPVADLRVDWAEGDPIGELETLWGIYKPQLNDYVTRALNPSGSPSYGVPGDE